MDSKFTLSIIGYGNMATAITAGCLKNNFLNKGQIVAFEKDPEKRDRLKSSGINVAASLADAVKKSKFILLCVKPQDAKEVLEEIKKVGGADSVSTKGVVGGDRIFGVDGGGFDASGKIIVSILAGTTKKFIKDILGAQIPVVRTMPNLLLTIGRGTTAIDSGDLKSKADKDFVFGLFQASGEAFEIEEGLLDAVTAISGSGPAYVYLFADAMIRAGHRKGLNQDMAKALTLNTLSGAADMIKSSDKSITDMIDAVCSKGGTTIEAVNVFKSEGLEKIVDKAVSAAFEKAKKL
jgi:pyrroline-5-carboxylate reductase